MNIFNAVTPILMKIRDNKISRQKEQSADNSRLFRFRTWTFVCFLFPSLLMAQASSPDIEYSPFDESVFEPLMLMALQLQEHNQHVEAIDVMEKAWQVNRVSSGLYNESQVDLIEHMIESEIELENWDAVSSHYDYLEHLYHRIYDIDDPELESGLQKLSSWYVNAFTSNLNGKGLEHLRKAHKIFKLRLEIAELTLKENHPKFDFLQESLAISEHQLYLASDIHKAHFYRSRVRDQYIAGIN